MTRLTDPLFDQRIADWLEDDPLHAPDQVLEIVLAALPSIPRRRVSRVPWRSTTTPTSIRWPLAAAAVIGVLAIGSAFYLASHPAVVGGPSQTPPSASPSQPASPSAGPSSSVVPSRAASWSATGSLTAARLRGTATLLLDGKVLVAGGIRSASDQGVAHPIATAELYDPSTGTWTPTGTMQTPRQGHTATLLPDGKVLAAGGMGKDSSLASAELYDPRTGSWGAAGAMGTRRLHATATLLPDGEVLVAGGDADGGWGGIVASAELYNPSTGTWAATGAMNTPRGRHSATLLPDGKVLVAGGGIGDASAASAELYDPGTGAWTATGSMGTARGGHTATLLPNGEVLVAGGGGLASAELYDPGRGTWTVTRSMGTPRGSHTATLLSNGMVFVVGGGDFDDPVASAELYDPRTGSWTATPGLVTKREVQSATLLPDGTVLVVSGNLETVPTYADRYDLGSP